MKKIGLPLFGLILLSGIGLWFFWNQNPPPTESQPTESTSVETASNSETTAETFPAENNRDNPTFWSTGSGDEGDIDLSEITIYMAQSADGVTFEEPEVFMQGAGVLSATTGEDGTLIVVFQWFPEGEEPGKFNQVAARISTDNGATWTDPETLIFKDFPDDWQAPYDPTITTTEDGRYRLFFTTHELGMDKQFVYGTAISDDGIHYTYEGVAFEAEDGTSTVDNSAVRVEDKWFIIAPMAKEDGAALDATSTDGLTFEESTSNRDEKGYWVGNMVYTGEEIRFYGSLKGTTYAVYFATLDGINWEEAVVTNLEGAADPAIAITADGTYLMFYPEPKASEGLPMPEDPDFEL